MVALLQSAPRCPNKVVFPFNAAWGMFQMFCFYFHWFSQVLEDGNGAGGANSPREGGSSDELWAQMQVFLIVNHLAQSQTQRQQQMVSLGTDAGLVNYQPQKFLVLWFSKQQADNAMLEIAWSSTMPTTWRARQHFNRNHFWKFVP